MNSLVKQKLIPLNDLCKTYYVDNLFLFGSAAKNQFNENSDLDFLVNFSSDLELLDYANNYFDFLEELKQLFNREVDLVTEKSLKNPILIQEINQTKIAVYES